LSKDFDLEFEKLLQESARVAAEFDASEEDQNLDQSQELSERHALRRVQGFSTELQDISEAEYRQLQLERVVLVGVWTEGTIKDAENSLAELKALARSSDLYWFRKSYRAQASGSCNWCGHSCVRW
jgi:GTP-binding protein HflX